eukprot:gene9791-10634_t
MGRRGCLHHNCKKHHGFISYRYWSEHRLAKKLQLGLEKLRSPVSKQLIVMFLDQTCAVGVEQMVVCKENLKNSRFSIPILSEAGIANIINANNPRGGRVGDNLLLELEWIVELLEDKKIGGIFCLLADGPNGERFNNFDVNRYPDEYHAHPLSSRRKTIRKTMETILDIGGVDISEDRFEDRIPIIQRFINSVLSRTYLGDLSATIGKSSIWGLNHLGYTSFTHSLGVIKFYGAGGYVLNSSSFGAGIALHLVNDTFEIYDQSNYGEVDYSIYLLAYTGMSLGAVTTVVVLSPILGGASVIGFAALGVGEGLYWALK